MTWMQTAALALLCGSLAQAQRCPFFANTDGSGEGNRVAFALVRWLPIAWKALGAGGFWRHTPRAAAPPPAANG